MVYKLGKKKLINRLGGYNLEGSSELTAAFAEENN